MPRNIRDRRDPNKRVVHVTNRAWEGLPFIQNHTMTRTIKSVLGMAQTRYQVKVCVFVFMTNHYHMILAGCGTRVSAFMNYVDGEIAKRMKRLFPERWGPKFWAGRYKEQHLATPQDVINKIIYICSNPLKARLVADITEYPGANSFASLDSVNYTTSELNAFTYSRFFKPIEGNYLSKRSDLKLAESLLKNSTAFIELKTNLFAWTACFSERIDLAEVIIQIKQTIAANQRAAAAHGVIGARGLRAQRFDKPHKPEKKGITPFIECADRELRKALISSFRNFKQLCRQAWLSVLNGFNAAWPRGAFVPPRRWQELKLLPT